MSFGLKQSFGRICKRMPDFIGEDFPELLTFDEWAESMGLMLPDEDRATAIARQRKQSPEQPEMTIDEWERFLESYMESKETRTYKRLQ